MKKKISIFGIIYSTLLLVSFYQTEKLTDPFIIPKHFFLAFVAIFAVLLPLYHYSFTKNKLSYSLNLIDISIYAYFIYITFHLLISGGTPFLEINWINWLILIALYTVYKQGFITNHPWNKSNKFTLTIIAVLIFIGIGQSLFGFGQYFGLIKNLQPNFRIGGAFGNPGPFANYLVAILPFSLVFAVFYPKGLAKYIAILSTVLLLSILPFTAARTAWIAAGAVIAYTLVHTKQVGYLWHKYFKTWQNKIILISIALMLLVSGIYALTSFKQDSASGRLFIWKVSLEMIKDAPVLGHGYSSYAAVHNNYQANYFRANPNDWENAFLADGVNNAFNEYIQIASEIGLIGLFLFLFIFFAVFRSKYHQSTTKELTPVILASEGSILAILVCSLFSYPLNDIPVLTILFFSLTIISANNNNNLFSASSTLSKRRFLTLIILVLSFSFFKTELNRFRAEKSWLQAFHLVRKGKFNDAKKEYADLYSNLKYNQFFVFNYGAELSVMKDYPRSIDMLKRVENRLNDSDFYIYLGNGYEGIGDLRKALECFEQASYIMPVKFYPKYRTVLLYQQLGLKSKAKEAAQKIIDMPIKVESELITGIKKEMSNFLQNQ